MVSPAALRKAGVGGDLDAMAGSAAAAPAPPPDWRYGSKLYRAELNDPRAEIFGHWPDPNCKVIDWLRRNAAPDWNIASRVN